MVEKKEIELIPKEIEAAKEQAQFLTRFRLAGLGVLGVGLGFSVLFWGLVLAQTARLNIAKDGVAKQTVELSAFAETEKKILGLVSKSSGVAKVFTERDYFSVLVTKLKDSTPAGLTVTGLSAQKDKALATISGETLSYNELSNFLRNLVDPARGGDLFTEATLTSVTLDSSTGKTDFVVELIMVRNGLKKPLVQE